jgi:hypothetical protein
MQIRWQKWLDNLEEIVTYDENDEEVIIPNKPQVITIAGIVPTDFNFWLGHTDFPITNNVAETISEINGVEVLDVITKYRFRIGVGLAFSERVVKLDIQEALGVKKEPVAEAVDKQKITKPYWAIYTAPNGKTEHFESDNEEEVYTKLELFEKTQLEVGGKVLYWKTCA